MHNGCKKWAIGCGVGCAVLAVLGIGAVLGGGYMMMKPFNDAISTREELETLYPGQDDYAPPPKGVTLERLQRFLKVREAMVPMCEVFQRDAHVFEKMDKLDQAEDPPKDEVLEQAWEVTKTAVGLAPTMGRFFRTRNQALLEQEMGLGEYTYLYALTYGAQLKQPRAAHEMFGSGINSRVTQALADMMRRQVDAMRVAGSSEEHIQVVQAQIDLLDTQTSETPWAEGPPEFMAGAYTTLAEELQELYCPETVTLELSRNRQVGPSIHSE